MSTASPSRPTLGALAVPKPAAAADTADEFAAERAEIERICGQGDVADVLVALNQRARAYLAAVDEADATARELLVQMIPPGTRQVLELRGALESRPADGESELVLTDFGAEVAAAATRLGWHRTKHDQRQPSRAVKLAAGLAATAVGAAVGVSIVGHQRDKR